MEVGQTFGQNFPYALLMSRIRVAVQETDRHAANPLPFQGGDQRPHCVLVEDPQHLAGSRNPLGHREATAARNQRRPLVQVEVILVVATLVSRLDDVAKSRRGDQGAYRPLAFDDRVRGEGGPMDQQVDVAGVDAGILERGRNGADDAILRRLRRGQALRRGQSAWPFERDVGEGAADVYAETESGLRIFHAWLIFIR